MKALIIYVSRHGTTEKIAQKLASIMDYDTSLHNLKKDGIPSMDNYDIIFLGGSIHAGQIQKSLKKFMEKNKAKLLSKKIALFMACMMKGEKASEQFNNAFPQDLREHAVATACLGGEFLFEKMNFFEKAIVKKVANIKESKSEIDEKEIAEFTARLRNVF